MFDNLFGAEMPLAVRFFLAFLIVLGLIGVTAWAVRRFGAGRLGGASARGRQPRLAVIDYASVDGRRRLILVRRDNVEHLLMIGGPTDVVVEPNIVRAVAAPRDVARDLAAPRPSAGIDALPRAIPLPENGNGPWPLQPEPVGTPRPSPRIEPSPEELPRPLSLAEPPPRPRRDTLAALADELSARPTPPRRPAGGRPMLEESQPEQRSNSRPEPRKPIAPPAAVPNSRRSAARADCTRSCPRHGSCSNAGSKPSRYGATPRGRLAQAERGRPPARATVSSGASCRAGADRTCAAAHGPPRRSKTGAQRRQAEPEQDHAL